MLLDRGLKETLGLVMSLLKLELQSKLEAQGHGIRETSKLINSIEFDIKSVSTVLSAGMYLEDYYVFVEKGVSASRIPFYPGSGKRQSKYIRALISYWRFKRGLSDKAAFRAAFALANKHKKEGMPTRSSFSYSKDGTRLGFVDSTLKNYEQRAFELLQSSTLNKLELSLIDILKDVVSSK